MEENADVHMETDVSSTTDDVVDTQEVTGSNGQVEMTITVEKVDEASLNKENDTLSKIGNNVSSGSITKESPVKDTESLMPAQTSPSKESEVSKPIQNSPAKNEPLPKVTSINTVVTNSIQVPAIDPKAESADSSTKVDSLTSPSKEKNCSIENKSEKDHGIPRVPVMKNIKQAFLIVKKSPNMETSILSSIKDSGVQKVHTPLILKSPSKEKPFEKSPVKKAEEPKPRTYQVIHSNRSPSIKSPPIKLVRKQTFKDFKVHDTTINEPKLQDTAKEILLQVTTKPSESKDEPILETTKVNGETAIPKPSQNEEALPSQLPCTDVPMDVIEAEVSNDSQLSYTTSEKEHKSISRELRSLINSAKESKIISECTQLTSKTRKSRTNLDTSLNMSVEADMIQDDRNVCCDFDKPLLKRSMRSQNPDFVTKCKQFLNSVTSKVMKDSDDTQSDSEPELKQKHNSEPHIETKNSEESSPKKKKVEEFVVENNSSKLRSDPFCWRCHWQLEAEASEKQPMHPPMACTVCVRSYHSKCMTVVERRISADKNWVCPDCLQILHAESSETRSPAMKKISLGMLCDLLKFGLERMEALNGVEPFLQPVDRTEFPDYDKIVVHPMDLSQMRKNISDGHYGSTEAFIADAQWILHNSILFNACEQTFTQSKLTSAARALVRTCRSEMTEIETCPECYAGAHSRNLTFFTEVCSTPHMILWAKLKGFPYWPAKAVAVNNGMVDVRFFGQHDKSWVPVRDCYLYSEKDPNTTKSKKQELIQCRLEAEVHIRNICRKYGSFVYAPFKTTFDHTKLNEQLKMMIPSFDGEIRTSTGKNASPVATNMRRSTSKSSKSSYNDGDISECDESSTKSTSIVKKTVEPDEEIASKEDSIARLKQEPNTSISDKDKTMVVDVPQTTEPETTTRKRRRSTPSKPVTPEPFAESTAQKKKKVDEKPEEKIAEPEPSKEKKSEPIKNSETEVEATTNVAEKSDEAIKDSEKVHEEKGSPITLKEHEAPKVTPIKLVALPRANKQTPKIFTTAKVTSKSTPSTPTNPSTPTPSTPNEEDKSLNTSSSKRSKITKADKFIITEQKGTKARSSRRNSRSNRSLSTPKHDKSDKKSENKKSDSSSDVSSSQERSTKKKDDSDRSLLKKEADVSKSAKDDSAPKKKTSANINPTATTSQENKNSNSGLPTISNVVSLSTTAEKANTKTTSKNKAPKSIEITIEANSDSSIFTPTSSSNVGNMKEAVSKLQKLRNETTENFVGRVGVKAFARMTSPDINEDVEVKTEAIELDEADENRQIEKMDLMNACKLQPVTQTQSLRDVRINKVVITPSILMKKPAAKALEPRPRAKKTFPQPKRQEGGSELNGKNSMVYIPIQPPMTQPPLKTTKPPTSQHGVTMPVNVNAGPRLSATMISTNSVVNTVTTPLRPTTSLSSSTHNTSTIVPVTLSQASNISQVPTVGPATVHTVPLMTSVNGQWMFSLQPVMSVGAVDNASSPPMVNGITERPGTTLVPVSSSTVAPNATVLPMTPMANRNQISQNTHSSPTDSNGTPLEMPRLLQRPLMSPFDVNTPIGNVPPPSTAGPLTAKLNQNAVKLTDFFRNLLEDSIDKLDEPLAQVTALKIQLEQARWRNQQNLDELKHNNELTLSEMRQSFEKEKVRIVSETRRAAQIELEAAVKLTKSKQWCTNCSQEAQFYCCWNTVYCDYSCQRAHWNAHYKHCSQNKGFKDTSESRLQQGDSPPALQKSAPSQTPCLTTMAGKPAPMRVFTDSSGTQKTSIIVSMIEDTSGNQTLKCLGTYKAPAQAQPTTQISPLLINKQTNDDGGAAKKTVTSGGYLIVGASSNTSSVITPASASRRPHVQYFS